MALSFQPVLVMWKEGVLSWALSMATEEEVKTKRLREGSFVAAEAALRAPARVGGMTRLGSGEKERSEATWAMPEQPVFIRSVLRWAGRILIEHDMCNTKDVWISMR